MSKLEQGWMAGYLAALKTHGLRGVALHRAAKLALRSVNAAAYHVAPGSQAKTRAWKEVILAGAHHRAMAAIRRLARSRHR